MKNNSIHSATMKFPLEWHSSLIVSGQHPDTDKAIEKTFLGLGVECFSISRGKVSSQSSYCSWQLSAQIADIMVFRAVCTALGELPGVKMLL